MQCIPENVKKMTGKGWVFMQKWENGAFFAEENDAAKSVESKSSPNLLDINLPFEMSGV